MGLGNRVEFLEFELRGCVLLLILTDEIHVAFARSRFVSYRDESY